MLGFLNVLKPPGMTSHDVVQVVRKLANTRQVGHTGTLDPLAAGVLVLAVGQATRLSDLILRGTKRYRAELTLGLLTDSGDAEGKLLEQIDASEVTRQQISDALPQFVGELTMRPPAHSAVRIDGRKAYELARSGEVVDMPERTVTINALHLVEFSPGRQARALLDIECSHGTYVRSLAMMIGEAIGPGAMLSALLRTRVGTHTIEQSVTIEELEADLPAHLLGLREALPRLPVFTMDASQANALTHGQAVETEYPICDEPLFAVDEVGEVICLAEMADGYLWPRKVFAALG